MNANILIGERIKNLRESKSVGVEEMSERTELDITQIEKIEQSEDIPSLASLIKIARVLGVRPGTFLDDHDELGPIVTRKETHDKKPGFSTKDTSSRQHMDYYPLSLAKSGRHMEPFIIDIAPVPEETDFVASSHEGEEFIYCLNGIIEIKYGAETYILKEGDSIYYDSIVPHHVHAGNALEAKILAVVYTPF